MAIVNALASTEKTARWGWVVVVLLLAGILAALFHGAFRAGYVVFANDGPLGLIQSYAKYATSAFVGYWQDIYWLGTHQPSASPNITQAIYFLTGHDPVLYSKIYAPTSLLILGLCAWIFFRQLGFAPVVCVLAALATALNTDFFSNACWGLPIRALSVACVFLALAALQSGSVRRPLLKTILAGMAMGMGLMEGYDLAAILSLYLAAFAFFLTLVTTKAATAQVFLKGIGRVALVALFAAFMAAQTLTTLIGTQLKGVAGMAQDEQTKIQHWGEATQWSLPKAETLRVIIPGLFGYRMETPDGANYWGRVGEDPAVPELKKALTDPREEVRSQAAAVLAPRWRYSGSGEYAGVLVVLLACWALVQSFRGAGSPYSLNERRFIWFWSGLAFISLLLAFGRWAPFYQFVYALPYFSTIRNPIKFMTPFHLGLVILFGYGLHDLTRRYLTAAVTKPASPPRSFNAWWSSAPAFDKKWTFWSLVAVGASLLGWLFYASARGKLEQFLQNNGFNDAQATAISRYSVGEVGWFILFLALSVGLVVLIVSRVSQGRRALMTSALLGLVLVADLSRANLPWVTYINYQEKYASNGLFDLLREKPYEHRVSILPFRIPHLDVLQQLYQVEWLQLQFPYYNIQCLDIPQDARRTEEKKAYLDALTPMAVRYWQLTSTRYLLGLANLEEALNQQLDPALRRFRKVTGFNLEQDQPGAPILVQTNATGPFALLEFTGVLPRASLFTHWEVNADSQAALQRLTSTNFDPLHTLIVATNLPTAPAELSTNAVPGTVAITSYSPKKLVLKAETKAPAVLLLNDRFDPNWRVWVDNQSETLLRCNYMVRGVYLKPGEHTVEFRFEPPATSLYVSLAALVTACLVLGIAWRAPGASAAGSSNAVLDPPKPGESAEDPRRRPPPGPTKITDLRKPK
jgi:hypothetical protein